MIEHHDAVPTGPDASARAGNRWWLRRVRHGVDTLETADVRRHLNLAGALLLALGLAACGAAGDGPVDSDGTPPPGSGQSDAAVLVIADGDPIGDGIRVVDALAHRGLGDVLVVSGALFVDADGGVKLCDAIAESFPPQCGGDRIRVEGLDLDTIDLQEANGVRWSEGVILLGSVE